MPELHIERVREFIKNDKDPKNTKLRESLNVVLGYAVQMADIKKGLDTLDTATPRRRVPRNNATRR
jgi:hypothetical protein